MLRHFTNHLRRQPNYAYSYSQDKKGARPLIPLLPFRQKGNEGSGPFFQRRSRSLESNRSISMYNQMRVTIKPNAAYHSMYLGTLWFAADSMKSKSRTRFNAAIPTT